MERQAYTMMKAGDLEQQHWLIAQNIERMVDILGACERILKTPVPYSYSMFLKKFIFLYVVTAHRLRVNICVVERPGGDAGLLHPRQRGAHRGRRRPVRGG